MAKTPTNFTTEYLSYRSDIARLMDVLEMELNGHAETARADPTNYDHVSDVAKIREDLINLIVFTSDGMSREEIEQFLSETIDE